MQNKNKGFTLIEILVVGLLLSIVMVALFMCLSIGDLSGSVGRAKADLQADVRLAMDWIIKDVRQTFRKSIDDNSPTGAHLKFRKVSGIDYATGNYTEDSDYIEYTYDSVSHKLTRNKISGGVTTKTWEFNDILEDPSCPIGSGIFFTAPCVPLAYHSLDTADRLMVTLTGQKQLRGSRVINFFLIEEVKFRNM